MEIMIYICIAFTTGLYIYVNGHNDRFLVRI